MAHDRREFLKLFAGISALPLLSRLRFVDTLKTADQATAKTALSDESKAYVEVARAKFGNLLSEDELKQVSKDINHKVKRSAKIQKYALTNSDEPDFTFSAE